ncbi:energy-coupling factor transporter transmembrane component T family protein [Desulfitibacter alkalitolerans]|uniref:energy-coupling factor transporter transmembrane component T family protein n=1 Tax=Desulfitibacter alkalitolerans TaxID=264641 RepID=UPI0004878EC8|nr:energy-coupling factor transporter transmembrane component T [Desulfitibacter alkalitolerans]
MSSVASYITKSSLIHNLHPLTKIFGALWFLTLSIIVSSPVHLGFILLMVILCGFAARIPNEIIRSLKAISIFAFIIFLIQILFYKWGTVVFYMIPGVDWLPVTREGILFGIAIALRMMIILLSFIIFLSTTQTRDMMMVLVEKLKVPYDYAFMFVTSLRFIPTFMNEVAVIQEAQKARGYRIEGANPLRKIKSYLPIALPLVLISLAKGERLALAMETRAYNAGIPRTYLRQWRMEIKDGAAITFMLLALVLAVYIR